MQSILPWLAIAILIVAGWMLIKRSQSHMTLLFAGLAMILLALGFGVTNILPKGAKSTGLALFNVFDLLRVISIKQVTGIGFLIMTAGGFAGYMDRIGAANALVKVCTAPLKKLSQPYLVLVLGYIIGQVLVTVIPSAAGLAMLLLVALYPILKGVGLSAGSAVAVIGTSAGMTFAPTGGTANLAAKTAGLDPVIYLVQYQVPIAICVLIAVAITHFFVQRYFDKKNDDVYAEPASLKPVDQPDAPLWYAIWPILPIVLLIIFSKLVCKSITLNTITALYMVWVLVVLVELIRFRSPKKVFDDAMAFFKKMGGMFASIVALIICAEFFATGLKVTGVVSMLISSANGLGLGMTGMTTVLTGIVGAVTFLTGSGVGAYSSFAALAPDVAAGLGGNVTSLVTPMQFASGMFRAMSPVAGVIIAVAGAAGISPMAVVRRTWLPMVVGMITCLTANFFFNIL